MEFLMAKSRTAASREVALITTAERVAALEPVRVPALAIKAALSCTGEKVTDIHGKKHDVPDQLRGVNIASRDGEIRVSATDGHRLLAFSVPMPANSLPAWLKAGVTVSIELLKEQLAMIDKFGEAVVVSYQTNAPRVLLSDPSEHVTFRSFPVESEFPNYDNMLAGIDLSARMTVDLASTAYQAAYLKGVADLAKLLESSTVQVFGSSNPEQATLITFPGCPGAVLLLMPVLVDKNQSLTTEQARILLPTTNGTIGALRANRTRTMARLEKQPNNRALQKKVADYDQRIEALLNRTQPKAALPAPAPDNDDDEQSVIEAAEHVNGGAKLVKGEDKRAAQRGKLKGAVAQKALTKFCADVNAVLSRENDGLTIHQLADGVPLEEWFQTGLSPEQAAKRCLDWRMVGTMLPPDEVGPGEAELPIAALTGKGK
jgi:hypothetical protein